MKINIVRGIGKFYWKPTWFNTYSYKDSGYKCYRWGYWNLIVYGEKNHDGKE